MKQTVNLPAVMRDQVVLRYDLYSPDEGGAYPVILQRTPYGKQFVSNDPIFSDFERYTKEGYHVAVMDCRGTGESDGILRCNGDNEYLDGYDSIEWIAAQTFCNGHVGMCGLSYNGFDQMAAAVTAPPHLDVICPFMTQVLPPYGMSIRQTIGSYHLFWVYGQLLRELDKHIPDKQQREALEPVLRAHFATLSEDSFQLPMNQNPAATIPGVSMFEEYLRVVNNVENEAFWRSIHHPSDVSKLNCAVFHATGWFDGMKDTTVDNFHAVRDHGSEVARRCNKLLIGPWCHSGVMDTKLDGFDFGEHNTGKSQDVVGRLIRWYDRFMKGIDNGLEQDSNVRYYIMEADQWRESADWPPVEAVDTPLYLRADKQLSLEKPAQEAADTFVYDPQDPMPSGHRDKEGRVLLADWSEVSNRDDMLTYETAALEKAITIAGTIHLELYAMTDAVDTDFSCRIVDVYPSGYEFEMAAGLVRAKYRDAVLFKPRYITPGRIEHYDVIVGNTARMIRPGHKIKAYVSSALYPAHDRNLNTGAIAGKTAEWVKANQTIYHDTEHPTHLHLPVIPNEE